MERDAFRDDPLLQAVVARLAAGGDEAAAEVLEALIERLRVEAIGAVMETLPPSRPMDYPARPIRLVVSSSEIGVRLLSAEKEPFTVEWIEKSIKPGDVFYDNGANVGSYALIAAKSTDNRARVFAFEPSPSSFLDLSRNVALNGCADSVTPLPLALWSHNELLSLAARPTVGGTPSRPNVAGAAEHRIGPAAGDQGSVPIIGVPLDDLVERLGLPVPTHAKIDTDGYELEVLRGAKRTLVRREWRSIILELDRDHTSRNEQIRSFLAERGFVTERLHERLPSPAFPDPASRPDVYCTFSRQSPVQPRRPPRIGRPGRSRTTIQAAQRRAVTLTLAVITALFLLLVFLPEELGDRPYDVFGLRF